MLNAPLRRRAVAALLTLAAIGSAPALAQPNRPKNEPPQAPIATTAKTGETSVITLLLVIVLVFGIIGVNFIPSKRGHQD